MAFIYSDRVKEQSSSIGLTAMVLSGAVPSFRTFLDGVGDMNQTYYTIVNDADNTWEVGSGTYMMGSNSLSRDTVIASSNANSPVNFAAGTKTVFASVAAQFFGAALTATTHAAINHTGIAGVPAPETFTSGTHQLVDHTAVPFQLLDSAGHEGIDHTVAPLNLLDEPAHDALDHTGVPGVNDFDSAMHSATNHAGILGVGENNPLQVTGPERTAGTETALRSYSPLDVATMAGVHGGSGIGKIVDYDYAENTGNPTGTTVVPFDTTIPQITEGNEFLNITYTPADAANILVVEAEVHVSHTAGGQCAVSLFSNPTANALKTAADHFSAAGAIIQVYLLHRMVAGTTSPIDFRVRAGTQLAGTMVLNGVNGPVDVYGSALVSWIRVTELAP